MDDFIPPFAVTLHVQEAVFVAREYSEAGLTLPARAFEALDAAGMRRGEMIPATVVLRGRDWQNCYEVSIRIATMSALIVEVAFVELPAQLRLRLRHASRLFGVVPGERSGAEHASDRLTAWTSGESPKRRRLALQSSHGVLAVTAERRAAISGLKRTEGEALENPHAEPRQTIRLRRLAQSSVQALIGVTLIILALAMMFVVLA